MCILAIRYAMKLFCSRFLLEYIACTLWALPYNIYTYSMFESHFTFWYGMRPTFIQTCLNLLLLLLLMICMYVLPLITFVFVTSNERAFNVYITEFLARHIRQSHDVCTILLEKYSQCLILTIQWMRIMI